MKAKFLSILLLPFFIVTAFSQAPNISYTGATQTYTTGLSISPLVPTNLGGSVPAKVYGQVTTIAGSLNGQSGGSNGKGNAASFYGPTSVVSDASGNLYVADCFNGSVRKITPDGTVSTLATGFDHPRGIAVDASGNVYVANSYANNIKKISPAGVVSNLAGSGQAGGANGIGAAATFYMPQAVVVDASGNVYVGDQYGNTIRKITSSGVVSSFAGGNGSYFDSTGTDAGFDYPAAFAIHPVTGEIYVSDRNNSAIRKVTPAGVVSTFLGYSYSTGTMHGTVTNPALNYIGGLAFDANGNIYFNDQFNYLFRKVTPAGDATTIAGSGIQGIGDGVGSAANFDFCGGVAVDPSGNVFVADQSNNSIRKVEVFGYTISPALPAGLSFDATTGTISGIPTVPTAATTYVVTAYNNSGSSSTTITIATVIPPLPPIITAFTPTTANTNAIVSITGSNFLGATNVAFGGVSATSFNVLSPTNITVAVPAGAISGSVTVTNAFGTATLDGFVSAVPHISYAGPQAYVFNTAITPLTPKTTGIAVPTSPYGQVSTFAGTGAAGKANGPSSAATFNGPKSIATEAAGNTYVADEKNNLIRKITPAGVVSTLAGSGSSGFADGTGTSASFSAPSGIAVDASGNVFIADCYNNSIRKITPAGVVTTFAGNYSQGTYNGSGGTAQFYYPRGLAFDNAGNLLVADAGNNQIRKITPAGVVSTFAGAYPGYRDGIGTAASFNNPTGLITDAAGNVFVADAGNNVIRKITPAGVVTTVAGSYYLIGLVDGTGTAARFGNPTGITADSYGNLFVADNSNNVIRIISPAGVVGTLAGTSAPGVINGIGSAAKFNGPCGIAFDGGGNLIVADYNNNLIRKIAISTGYAVTPALPPGLSLDNKTGVISGTPTALSSPTSYKITADNGYATGTTTLNIAVVIPPVPPVISSFTPPAAGSHTMITITGINMLSATGVTIGGLAASFKVISSTTIIATVPTGVSSGSVSVTNVYGTGSLGGFVATPSPNISYNSAQVYTIGVPISPLTPLNAGSAVPATSYGQVSTYAGTGKSVIVNGPLAASGFYYPNSIAFDASGNMYVADEFANIIRKITPAGVVSTFAGNGTIGSNDGQGNTASFNFPSGVAVDAAGNVYVADYYNNKIRKITPGGLVSTFAGSTKGYADAAGIAAKFNQPYNLAVDAAGNVYVADQINNLIRKITPDGTVSTLAGSTTGGNVNGAGTAARFLAPIGIAVDSYGNVYVGDTGNNEIRKITPDGAVTTLAGSGPAGSTNGSATAATFNNPQGLTIDAFNNIYVADNYNKQVRIVAPDGTTTTLAGNGINGAIDGLGPAVSFAGPTGLAIDAQGSLYVADADNFKIRKISLTGYAISAPLPAGLNFDTTTGIISGTPKTITPATNYTITGYSNSGNSSATVNIATQIPAIAPVITSFTPTTTGPNNVISITGSYFLGATAVTIGGVSVKFNTLSTNTITAIVPPNTPSGNVTVTNPIGFSTLSGFTYIPAPIISYNATNSFITGTPITPLSPVSTGGAVLATVFTQTSVLAGSGKPGAIDGVGLNATFNQPDGIAIDKAGNMYVTTFDNKIRKITPGGVVTTITNGVEGYLDGALKDAQFSVIKGIAIDGADNLYVADSFNNRIRKITPGGVVTTYAGNGAGGPPANGNANAVGIYMPTGIAVDAAGNVYVSDGINSIHKITPDGIVSTLAGSFSVPAGLACDAAGNVYVADYGINLIRKITPEGLVTTLAGNGAQKLVNGTGGAASFYSPSGLCVDALGNVYVADHYNNVIRMITPAGVVTTLAGNGSTYSMTDVGTAVGFYNPSGIASDGKGNLFITDNRNNLIRKIILTGYSVSPALPAGLTFDSATGIISGTPTAVSPATDYTVTAHSISGNGLAVVNIATTLPPVAPVITSFSPAAGPSGTAIVVSGYYLLGATSVTIGGVAANFNSILPTMLTAVVPVGAKSGDIVITNASGTATKAGFTFTGPPSISYTSPMVLTTGSPISPLAPANSGVPIPSGTYSQVTTLAGGSISNYGAADGTGTAATFATPFHIATGAAGYIYVADAGNNLIRKVTPAGVVTTVLPNTYIGESPAGVAIDASGNIYFANNFIGGSIQKVTPAGLLSTIAGNGEPGLINGTGLTVSFNNPNDIAIDAAGNLFVADESNQVIRKITATGDVSTFAGSGVAGFADGPGTTASFNLPIGIAVDGADNLYVADLSNHAIRKITPAGVVSTLAGNGTAGFVDGKGAVARFWNPAGVCVDLAGTVYVADAKNSAIRTVSPAGVVSTLAGGVTRGPADGLGPTAQFDQPTGVAVDNNGNLYVADENNNNIRKIAVSGYSISPALPAGLSFDNATGKISGIATVISPATDYTVTGYSPSGNSITTINLSTVIPHSPPFITAFAPTTAAPGMGITITGNNLLGATTVTVGGVPAKFFATSPTSLSVIVPAGATAGNLSVTNPYGTATMAGFNILKSPNISYTNVAAYTAGVAITPMLPSNTGGDIPNRLYGNVSTYAGAGHSAAINGDAATVSFKGAENVATDAAGNVYVTEAGDNLIRKITPTGMASTLAGNNTYGFVDGIGAAASFSGPAGMAVDANANVYVADYNNNCIRKITPDGKVSTFAGNAYGGATNGTGTAASFYGPTGLAFDASGNLFVTDSRNNTIRKITPAGVVSTFAGSGVYGATDGTGTAATFNGPRGITVDGTGNLYVTDGMALVRKITPAAVVTTFAGNGSPGATNGTGIAASFNTPTGITIDALGNLYVGDTGNSLIRMIAPGGVVSTLAGNGSQLTLTNGVGTAARFYTPAGLAIDGQGNLFVADNGNNAIRAVSLTGYAISSTLVTGLNIDGTGTISGTPTAAASATGYVVNAYNGAGSSSSIINFSVILKTQAINFPALNAVTYGTADLPLTATASSGLGLTYSSSNTSVATIVNGNLHIIGVGTTVITATQTGNNIYTATTATSNLTVNAAPLTITAVAKTKTYGAANPVLTVSYIGFANGDDASSLSTQPTISTTATAGSPVGSYPITASGATSANYIIAYVDGALTITLAQLTIAANNATRGFGTINPQFTAIYTGFVNGDDATKLNTQATLATTATASSQAGTYPITVAGATSSNYSIVFVSGLLTISPTLPANNYNIVVNSVTCKGANNGTISITAAQSLSYTATITGNSVNTPYAFTTSTTINNLIPGTYNVCFTVAGQPNYQQCFSIVITEPKDLSVYSAVNKTLNTVTLTLNGGDVYNINLNGNKTTTTANTITLNLGKGNNALAVSTDKLCQGVFAQNINIPDNVVVYPNPFLDDLYINIGDKNVVSITVRISGLYGAKVYEQQLSNQSGYIKLALGNLKSGIYFLNLTKDGVDSSFKIIKK